MAKFLWLAGLLLAALLKAPAGEARIRICNDTEALHHLAVAARANGSWVAQGWQPVVPGGCFEPVPDGYQGRFFYFRTESPGYRFRDDSIRFCTAPGRFRAADHGDCAALGYAEQGFAKAVAKPADQRILLSTRSQAVTGSAAEAAPAGLPFAAEVVFQGCKPLATPETVACRFVGGGLEIGSEGRVQVSDPVFTFLLGLLPGAPLAIEGEMTSLFGTSGALDLQSVTPRAPNRFDRMLQQMQGEWLSVRNPKDRFSISGAVRQVSYAGRRMTPEFVSIQESCRGADRTGDFLMAWDSLRGTSLCYRIQSLTSGSMTLVYLPRGIRLDYRRLP
ncbi:DUF1036 domain-containing protein [Leisingera thetidis]|uniref:DUF1036 domain-containing protein n=1 Tax=Leisingera thetidis TaxID=2930199 RepID=UPI0021F77779|nr:DUF1036 domain-containing protein [Leisingera thetidis]